MMLQRISRQLLRDQQLKRKLPPSQVVTLLPEALSTQDCACPPTLCSHPSSILRKLNHSAVTTTTPIRTTVRREFSSSFESISNQDEKILALLRKKRLDLIVKVLEDIFYKKTNHNNNNCLKLSTFHAILLDCSNSKHRTAGFQAESFLAMLMEFYTTQRLDQPPDIKVFTLCLSAWANGRHPQAGERAEQILKRMERMSKRSRNLAHLRPDTISYSTVINAHAKSGNPEEAIRVLEEMYRDYQSGNAKARPVLPCFNAVIDGLARTTTQSKNNGSSNGQRAEAIVERMRKLYDDNILEERPNTITYNSVLNVYAKHGETTEAERILERMHEDHRNGNDSAKPDVRSYNIVLDGLARAHNGTRAEALLDRMLDLSSNAQDDDTANHLAGTIRPDVVSYNTVIHAYAKTGNTHEAERIMKRMYADYSNGNDSAKPNIRSFTTLLGALSRAADTDRGERAEAILDHMTQMNRKNMLALRPNTFIYTAVMNIWAELGNVDRSEAIFERMRQDYQRGNKDARPNLPCIRVLLKAWSNSGASNAGEQADLLLEWLPIFELKPDVSTLVSVQRCWEVNKDDPKARTRIGEIQEQISVLERKRS